MVKVGPWQKSIVKNQRFLTVEKIFSLAHIVRGMQLILVIPALIQYLFVNKYVDEN